jgi:predicted RNA binding protein YcfA (HicA-like mRNA interferase family)
MSEVRIQPSASPRAVVRILVAHGFERVRRGRDDHVRLRNAKGALVTVPVARRGRGSREWRNVIASAQRALRQGGVAGVRSGPVATRPATTSDGGAVRLFGKSPLVPGGRNDIARYGQQQEADLERRRDKRNRWQERARQRREAKFGR